MAVPTLDMQKLDPGALWEGFVLDATALGGGVTRFHGGRNQVLGSVVWQGNTYSPYPIQASGFDMSSKGVLPRPTIRVANVDGMVGGLLRTYQDLVGATVTRKRTFVKYLDAVNFTGGTNPTADPTAAFPDDVFFVERKATETKEMVEFELVAACDMQGLFLPRRVIQATVCPWVYKGTECGYVGALGSCSKLLDLAGTANGCGAHFGTTSALPFGGFPGAGTIL